MKEKINFVETIGLVYSIKIVLFLKTVNFNHISK